MPYTGHYIIVEIYGNISQIKADNTMNIWN